MGHKHISTSVNALIIGILLSFIFITPGKAQFVDLGQDPSSVRWRQIKTDNFQIIYPDFFEKNAQYLANIYEKLYAHANTLGTKAQKMSMIVRANGGVSNGNAGWAPKKSELYTAPPQEVSDAWLEHLCIHEFRHIVQYDRVNQGFTKALYYIFGEQITMAIIGVYIPMWFLEGDAVNFETSVGKSGRGRSPEFLNEMKAQITEKGIYTYYKAVLGSYKDFVPDRYTLGYYMVGNSRIHYGTSIWQDALTRLAKRPYGITPFARSLKLTMNEKRDSLWSSKHFQSLFINPDSVKKVNTHCDAKRTLYRDNFSELQQIWKQESDQINHTFDTIVTTNKLYTNYHYPTLTSSGEVIAYKEGLAQEGALVILHPTGDEIITRTGTMYDYKFAYNDATLVWSEYKSHTRWTHGGKMVLASYDMRHKKYRRYPTQENRYAPFAVGSNWGFVEVDKEDNASLVIVDNTFEKEIFRVKGTGDELFVHPSYDGQNNIITIVVSSKGKQIEAIDIHTGKRTPLTAFTPYEIDNPIVVNNQIIYRGAFDANNSLYRQTTPQQFGHNALTSKFGLRYPIASPDKDSILFSFYTSDGYKPGKIAFSKLDNKPIENKTFWIADSMTRQENWQFELTSDSTYASRKYNKTSHLFNFHSWGPIFPDADDVDVDFGLAASSQNKLSTLFLTAGYVRGKGYKHGNWQVKATYKGLWPILQLEFKSGRDDDFTNDYAIRISGTQQIDTVRTTYKFQRTKGIATVQFPFNISRKNYYRSITPYVKYEIQALTGFDFKNFYLLDHNRWTPISSNNPYTSVIGKPENIKLQVMRYGLILNNQTRMSSRDIYPRWGQRLEIGYEHTPFSGLDYGNSKWVEARFYLPGFWTHHSWTLYFGHQLKSSKTLNYYGNQINSPRGISLSGYDLSTLRISYAFPFWYPDAHVGPILYMKRFTAEPFFDAGWEKNRYHDTTFQSYGIEISAATHFFRLPFPINVGFRTGYETKKKSMFVDMLFSVAFTI